MLLAQLATSALTELTIALTNVPLVTTATQVPRPLINLSTCALWDTTAQKALSCQLSALTVNSQRRELEVKLVAPSAQLDTTV